MIEKDTHTQRERERERMNDKKERADELAYPLSPDRTAVETHYSRSKKIRKKVYAYLTDTSVANRSFTDRSDLAYQAANAAKCSYETAMRWINQYCSGNGDFYLFNEEQRIGWRRQQ